MKQSYPGHNLAFWNQKLLLFSQTNSCFLSLMLKMRLKGESSEVGSSLQLISGNLSETNFYLIKLYFLHILHNPVLSSQIRPSIDLISIHILLAVKKENNFKIGVKQFSYSFRSGYESLGRANLDCIMNLSLPIGIKLLKRWNFCRDRSFLL